MKGSRCLAVTAGVCVRVVFLSSDCVQSSTTSLSLCSVLCSAASWIPITSVRSRIHAYDKCTYVSLRTMRVLCTWYNFVENVNYVDLVSMRLCPISVSRLSRSCFFMIKRKLDAFLKNMNYGHLKMNIQNCFKHNNRLPTKLPNYENNKRYYCNICFKINKKL